MARRPLQVSIADPGSPVRLGFARGQARRQTHARVDVLPDGGFKPGPKAMGVKACLDACRFVKQETSTRTVVDPFCGLGTVLAVANALGLDAVGVDIAPRMCRHARNLRIDLDAPGVASLRGTIWP